MIDTKVFKAALSRDSEWSCDAYTLWHLPSKRMWWIANGPFFFDGYFSSPYQKGNSIGPIQRFLLWPAVRRLVQKLNARAMSAHLANPERSKRL